MLTGSEKAKLLELQEKEKNYEPLTDKELDDLEKADACMMLYPPEFSSALKSWSNAIKALMPLIETHMRLIRDIRHWKELANKEIHLAEKSK